MKQREMKFRAWHKANNTMLDLEKLTPLAIHTKLQKAGGGLFIPKSNALVIMQFTGLLDKNGKEIYEGDIILNPLSTKPEDKGFLVSWMVHGFYLSNVRGNMFEHEENKFIPFDNIETNFEIIGNIYEHPNLLNPQP